MNTLRLWSARAPDPLRLDAFNRAIMSGALAEQVRAEAISKVLYPSDSTPAGQELRLRQEYFFASASLQDLDPPSHEADRRHPQARRQGRHPAQRHASGDRRRRADAAARRRPWRRMGGGLAHHAGDLLLHQPHAAAGGAGDLAGVADGAAAAAPHADHLSHQRHAPRRLREKGAERRERRSSSVSLIDERNGRHVRMGHLAFLGSHKVNGVSALHSALVKETVFNDFHRLYPDRIVNKTNGVTFRRWLLEANPPLSRLLAETIGARRFRRSAAADRTREAFADDAEFQHAFRGGQAREQGASRARRSSSASASGSIRPRSSTSQIKRIHEYKRQLLNVLETIALYHDIVAQPSRDFVPRVKIFAGKAAASYHQAKLIIKLANDVAQVVNADPAVRGLAEDRLPAQLQCEPRRDDHSRRRSLRADFDRRHGGLGHRQYEIRAQRRAHHRHAGRRQCRNPRARRRRQHLHLRPHGGRRWRQSRAKGIDARETIAASPRLAEALRAIAAGVFSPDDPHGLAQSCRGSHGGGGRRVGRFVAPTAAAGDQQHGGQGCCKKVTAPHRGLDGSRGPRYGLCRGFCGTNACP